MLSQTDKEKLKLWCKGFFKDLDFEKFDFNVFVDNNITYHENKEQLRSKIKDFIGTYRAENIDKLKKSEAEVIPQERMDLYIITRNKEQERQAQLEFEKVLDKIEADSTTSVLEEIYFIPKQYAKLVAVGDVKALLLYGVCGSGKSYSVMRAFREVDKPFHLISGHITPLELYKTLYFHKTETIIFDDVNLLENKTNLNLLKSCLNDNIRKVCYNTSKPLDIPNSFIFEGKVIILVNSKAKSNPDVQAVESRCLSYEIKMDYEKVIKVLFELAKGDYKTISYNERIEIVRWIKENTSEATEELNLRKLFLVYEIYLGNKDNWKQLAKPLFKQDEKIELILTGIKQEDWSRETGLSRASYYNLKKSLKKV